MKRSFLAFMLWVISVPAFANGWTAYYPYPGDFAAAKLPPLGVTIVPYDFGSSYDESKCHLAFEKNGVAYSTLRIYEGEDPTLRVWAGSAVTDASSLFRVDPIYPFGTNCAIDWYGPSGNYITTWTRPEGADWDYSQLFLAENYPTSKENWNTVCWTGQCRSWSTVPEPFSPLLFLAGLGSIGLLKRRR